MNEPPLGRQTAMLFDIHIMVDWSSVNQPQIGHNSIWYALLDVNRMFLTTQNPPTRRQAHAEIRELLHNAITEGKRVLIGFDFPFGFPFWFANCVSSKIPPWKAVWQKVTNLYQDDENNQSNRFEVAAKLNKEFTGEAYPFWGCPRNRVTRYLDSHKHTPIGCEEFRLTEKIVTGPQSAFKLFGQGSVGSQSLTGIPYLMQLRYDKTITRFAKVWPFETDFVVPRIERGVPSIVFAEIYPSIFPIRVQANEVYDNLQVQACANFFAKKDAAASLERLFRLDSQVIEPCRNRIVSAEGWILGLDSSVPNGG